MPTISLRLTDEQHAELKEWAFNGRRSVQREIVWRLFTSDGVLSERGNESGGSVVPGSRPGTGLVSRDPAKRADSPRFESNDDPHFKPDFK